MTEDTIQCSICLEQYEDPHVLRDCLHTYCKKCISRLEVNGQVQCPNCQTITNLSNIKPDFIMQRIMEMHKDRKLRPNNPVMQRCGLCQSGVSTITYHCDDCVKFLCSGCTRGHKTTLALRSHRLTPLAKMFKDFDVRCRSTIADLEREVSTIDLELDNINLCIADIKIANSEQVDSVRKLTDKGILALKQNEKMLQKLVEETNSGIEAYLMQNKLSFEQQKKEINSKVSVLKYLSESRDVGVLGDTGNMVNETIKRDIDVMKDKIKQLKCAMKSPVKVHMGEDWNAKSLIRVTVGTKDISMTDLIGVSKVPQTTIECNFSDMYTNPLKYSEVHVLDFVPKRLVMINNQLWCTSAEGTLNIYDNNGSFVKEISYPMLRKAHAVAATDTGTIIVSCLDGQGLHTLDEYWQYGKRIVPGSFSSVEFYQGNIYALDYQRGEIVAFKEVNYGKISWMKVNQYQLRHIKNLNESDAFIIRSCGIYVSSTRNNCIFVYSPDGKLVYQTGQKGDRRPGQFNCPILCGVDKAGHMLVADCYNHRLQVCDSECEWHVVRLPSKECRYPADAVVTNDGVLWVIGNYKIASSLQKYWSYDPVDEFSHLTPAQSDC